MVSFIKSRKLMVLVIFCITSVLTIQITQNTAQDDQEAKKQAFMIALQACQQSHAANPGKCGLFGKIKIVDSFPDVKVQVVDSFPDLKVQVVKSFPDSPGKWQFVDSFPDYKVQYVKSFPDVKIKFVDSFPGCN